MPVARFQPVVEPLESRRLLNGMFLPKADLATGAFPFAATAADFNRDGWVDLAVTRAGAGVGDSSLRVFLNNKAGGFVTKGDYGTNNNPVALTSADYNGDRKQDIAVIGSDIWRASVFLNRGGGAFLPKVGYATGRWPTSIVSADFNGDGKADLATANELSGTISVVRNKGDGTFAFKVDYPATTRPRGITAADFNGDGRIDIAVAGGGPDNAVGHVGVFLNKGKGRFAAMVPYETMTNPVAVCAADMNGDGKADLVVANFDSDSFTLYLNQGDGTFGDRVDHQTHGGPSSIAAADFNGDRKVDLAIATRDSGIVTVLLNQGDGTYEIGADVTTGGAASSVVSADFNRDGNPDLAAVNYESGTVSVLLNGTLGARLATAPAVTARSKKAYKFTVTYTSQDGVDVNSIGDGDIRIVGPRRPGGAARYDRMARLFRRTASPDGKTVTVTYSIVPPGGRWDARDNGLYTVILQPAAVSDLLGTGIARGGSGAKLGTFRAAIGT